MQRKSLGNLGENLALKYLQNKGYKFIERNFRSKFGEIDLIFQDGKVLVFVEVKTRFGDKYGSPEEAINNKKLTSLIKTSEYFCFLNPDLGQNIRIDLIAIIFEPKTRKLLSLRHLENITL